MFVAKEKDVLREPNDDINTWFQTWDRDSKAGIGVDAANDPDADSYDSEYFDSLDSGEEDSEWSTVKRKKRYPEWKKKWDWSQTVELIVGLRFTNPKEFKEALQLFAVQNNFDYKYVHNNKKRVTAHCKSLSLENTCLLDSVYKVFSDQDCDVPHRLGIKMCLYV
jgi:hypothetical protein